MSQFLIFFMQAYSMQTAKSILMFLLSSVSHGSSFQMVALSMLCYLSKHVVELKGQFARKLYDDKSHHMVTFSYRSPWVKLACDYTTCSQIYTEPYSEELAK